MIKVMSLMKRRDDMSFEAFRTWLLDEHVEFAKNLPGLKKYTANALVRENPEVPYDGITELYFDSEEAMAEAFGTEAGKAAGGDAAAHCSSRSRLVCEERKQF